jgi:flagellar protein FliS
MFSPQFSPATGRSNPFASVYREVDAQTAVASATPHRLVAMLFDGYLAALAQALGALRQGQHEAKCHAIGRAARIIDEGLRAALNLREGGELAADLHALYGYLTTRLTLANLRNDEKLIVECQRLVTPLRDAWLEIGPRVGAAR